MTLWGTGKKTIETTGIQQSAVVTVDVNLKYSKLGYQSLIQGYWFWDRDQENIENIT